MYTETIHINAPIPIQPQTPRRRLLYREEGVFGRVLSVLYIYIYVCIQNDRITDARVAYAPHTQHAKRETRDRGARDNKEVCGGRCESVMVCIFRIKIKVPFGG